jgi:hypothetical protein
MNRTILLAVDAARPVLIVPWMEADARGPGHERADGTAG